MIRWSTAVATVLLTILPSIVCQLGKPLRYSVIEELPPLTEVCNIPIDSDLQSQYKPDIYDKLRYGFLPQSEGIAYQIFSVDEVSGVLKTAVKLDRDELCPNMEKCAFKMDVVVTPAQYFQIVQIEVEVKDLNDNTPTFPQQQMTFYIPESRDPGATYVIPAARDLDGGSNSIQNYKLLGNLGAFELTVTPVIEDDPDIRLVLKKTLDRERQSSYQLKVVAEDGGKPSKSGSVDINISITDVNDNNPQFVNKTYDVVIEENYPVGRTIVQVLAHDTDEGSNGEIIYKFSNQTIHHYGKLFAINSVTGEISVIQILNYEYRKYYRLTVTAHDKGPNSAPAQAVVTVTLTDANDNPPIISISVLSGNEANGSYALVSESLEIGGFVALLSVTDTDSGKNGQVNCSLNTPFFKLQFLEQVFEKTQYKIVTATKLDYENVSYYDFTMRCQDKGDTYQVSDIELHVKVKDENDHVPVFDQKEYLANIRENNNVGAYVTRVNASDGDTGRSGQLEYSIKDDINNLFAINKRTGMIIAKVKLDRERMDLVKFHVVVSDRGDPPLSASAVVSVKIVDRNDEKPIFSKNKYAYGVFENQPIRTEVGKITATDRDSGSYGDVTYSFDRSHSVSGMDSFDIDPASGKITTKKVLDREEVTVYYLVVIATDHGFPPLSNSVGVSIFVADRNDNAPIIIYPNVENNTIFVTSEKPEDYVVARVQAHDNDIGNSAKLSYSFTKGNEEDVFRIHPITGDIHLRKNLEKYTDQKFELSILVQDRGYPVQKASAELNIFINKTGVQLALPRVNELLSGSNLIIVLCLVIGSTILAAVLLVAIFFIKRKERKPNRSKYRHGYKIETQIMLDRKEESVRDIPVGASCSTLEKDNMNKEVYFSMEDSRLPPPPPSCSVVTETNPPTYAEVNRQEPMITNILNVGSLPPRRPGPVSFNLDSGQQPQRPWTLSERELEVHHLLPMLKQDGHSDAGSASNLSNADSGKGFSEEGDSSQSTSTENTPDAVSPCSPLEMPLYQNSPMYQNLGSVPHLAYLQQFQDTEV